MKPDGFEPQKCKCCDAPLDPRTAVVISATPLDDFTVPDQWEMPDPYEPTGLFCDIDCLNSLIDELWEEGHLEDWVETEDEGPRPWDHLTDEREDEEDEWGLNLWDAD